MSGNYGDISTSDWNVGLKNPAFVTIAAAPDQTPVFSWLAAVASSYLVFSGIKVEGTADSSPMHARYPLVYVAAHSPGLTSSNLVFTNMRVSSADDTSGWTRAEWLARIRNGGIFAGGRRYNLHLDDEFAHIERHVWRIRHGQQYAVFRQ